VHASNAKRRRHIRFSNPGAPGPARFHPHAEPQADEAARDKTERDDEKPAMPACAPAGSSPRFRPVSPELCDVCRTPCLSGMSAHPLDISASSALSLAQVGLSIRCRQDFRQISSARAVTGRLRPAI
jgi:hypothetical protein